MARSKKYSLILLILLLSGWVSAADEFDCDDVLNAKAKLEHSSFYGREILVYRDIGTCSENCAEAIGTLAEHEGSVRYVQADQITAAALANAKLYIQPGGHAIEVAKHMQPAQMQLIREFIAGGGAYLGICAGAFFADHFADDFNQVPALGLIPGVSKDFLPGLEGEAILRVMWPTPRFLYFQAGATFELNNTRPVTVLARYMNGQPAAIQFQYGRGTVVLSGPHPEAPLEWKKNLNDPDGDDFDLARDLLSRVLRSGIQCPPL